jgi:hypothetical protein
MKGQHGPPSGANEDHRVASSGNQFAGHAARADSCQEPVAILTMNIPARLFALLALVYPFALAAVERSYTLPASVMVLLEDETHFAPFAREVSVDVDRMIEAPPAGVKVKLLLGLRVHLGILLGRDDQALAASARIRDALPDDASKAYAGLVLHSFVVARQANPGPVGAPAFKAAFARDFATRLAALPATEAIKGMLAIQRGKVADMTVESLHQEFVTAAAALAGRERCTLAEADQLARLRHRFADLLPLRQELLDALDTAIASRTVGKLTDEP